MRSTDSRVWYRVLSTRPTRRAAVQRRLSVVDRGDLIVLAVWCTPEIYSITTASGSCLPGCRFMACLFLRARRKAQISARRSDRHEVDSRAAAGTKKPPEGGSCVMGERAENGPEGRMSACGATDTASASAAPFSPRAGVSPIPDLNAELKFSARSTAAKRERTTAPSAGSRWLRAARTAFRMKMSAAL
jgi:hypothetical protein